MPTLHVALEEGLNDDVAPGASTFLDISIAPSGKYSIASALSRAAMSDLCF